MKNIFIIVLSILILSCGDDNPIKDNDNNINVKTGDAVVSGQLKDGHGNPVSGAVVNIEGLETSTDENGKFHLDNVAEGKVNMTIKSDSYFKYEQMIYTEPDKANYFDLTLTRKHYTIDIVPDFEKEIYIKYFGLHINVGDLVDVNGNEYDKLKLVISEFNQNSNIPVDQSSIKEVLEVHPLSVVVIELLDDNGNKVCLSEDANFFAHTHGYPSLNYGALYKLNDGQLEKADNFMGSKISNCDLLIYGSMAYAEPQEYEVVDRAGEALKNYPLTYSFGNLVFSVKTDNEGKVKILEPDEVYTGDSGNKLIGRVSDSQIKFLINQSNDDYYLENIEMKGDVIDYGYTNDGMIYIYTGDLYRSFNNGLNWDMVPLNYEVEEEFQDTDFFVFNVTFEDKNTGIANFNDLLMTTNGGSSWHSKNINYNEVPYFDINRNGSGIAVTRNYNDQINYSTSNFGDTWELIDSTRFLNFSFLYRFFKEIELIDNKTVYCVTYKGIKINRTTNSGSDWETIYESGFTNMEYKTFSLKMIDSDEGYFVNNEEVLYTSNGGNNWASVTSFDKKDHYNYLRKGIDNEVLLVRYDTLSNAIENYELNGNTINKLDEYKLSDLNIDSRVIDAFVYDKNNIWYFTEKEVMRRRVE